jgi:CRP-like cAMP-binding protein
MHDALLAHVRRLISLTPHEEAFFDSLLKQRSLKKRQFLVQAGEPCVYDSFVTKGCLRATYTRSDGQEHVVQFAVEGWWIGDVESFLTGEPASYNVEALEDCDVLQLSLAAQERLFQEVPQFERYFRLIFQRSYAHLQRRVLASLSQSAEERYRVFAQQYPDLVRRVPQYHIAAYLGMTPEFLSQLRQRLARPS